MKTIVISLITLFITLSITGCTRIDVEKKDVANDKPDNSKVQFGVVSKDVFKKLEIEGDRAIIGAIGKDGNLHFYGQNGNKFKFPDINKKSQYKKGNGKLLKKISIEVYQNSPECFRIEPGDGTVFWYPWDCPK